MPDEAMSTVSISLTSDVVAAYVSNNSVPVAGLTELIVTVHAAFERLRNGVLREVKGKLSPAVSIRHSVTTDYIICLEDGRRVKLLKRHLSARYGLTPDQYRAKWDLPSNYPMVAPAYAAARSTLAKSIGLGRKRNKPAPGKAEAQADGR
ncbi:MucR family transcriptional regulator [Mesorhizobium sp. B2-4-14]|uniref:MucR family transcriptional regulator n=1 Tax=Mesorhizobium sp. B2-4-14 TaxID=2589935 RepID=UPI00112775B7|nr:MucR family transcriptional regulator [Mesorhizobium sp. B2-4-14]TPL11742.1 MucR family transcriptional regulator [Mesorhizobium sp. B2-4-14]